MATQRTTFTALTSGTRDSTADKADQYMLNGNTTNGRLNISSGARWKVGANTHIVYTGAPNHSYMNGIIESNALTIVAAHPSGRCDFSSPNGGMVATDITYLYLGGAGTSTFNHLENANNVFSGFVRLVYDMGSGAICSTQFASKEHANVQLEARATNLGSIGVNVGQSGPGFTSLTGFKTKGLTTLHLTKWLDATNHGRIYDPTYEGVTNNLLTLTTNGSGTGTSYEFFTIDLTAIRSNDLYIRTLENGTQKFNMAATVANTTLYANDGTTPLAYYSGKRVVPMQVRAITSAGASTTRTNVAYRLRQKGKVEIDAPAFQLHAPIVITEMATDESYDTGIDGAAVSGVTVTGTNIQITAAITTQQLYNYLSYWLSQNMSVDWFISFVNGTLTLANPYYVSFSGSGALTGAIDDANGKTTALRFT